MKLSWTAVINYVEITNIDNVFEIGCGNGKFANYLSKQTNASIHGIDYSSSAINYAQELSKENELLHFSIGDINSLNIPINEYSVILLIDSVYFSNDSHKILEYLYKVIKLNGRIVIFYSDFIFDIDKQVKKIESNETEIAVIIEQNG